MRYNVEIYNRTAQIVVANAPANTEAEASSIAKGFILRIKDSCTVIKESLYDISPRGYVLGQTLCTADTVYAISTGKTM